MEEIVDIRSAIEYYIMSGVDEIAGDAPFDLNLKVENSRPVVSSAPLPGRQATTNLSQATNSAYSNALEICSAAQSLEELKQAVEKFEGCSLKLTAANTVFGDGNPEAKIVLIGEAPGADEDRIGIPFVGRSGHLLDKMMAAIGMDRTSYYITNVLPWRPPGNRTPTSAEISICLPFLKKQLDFINPDYILLLGGSAANALLDNQEPISKLRGKWLEYTNSSGRVIKTLATFHPAYLLRNAGQKSKAWTDLLRLQKKNVE